MDMDLEHYCDGCSAGSDDESDHLGEWCCGGDGHCPAVAPEPDCTDPDGHEWTRKGCGGCSTNPGVWSLGGTAFQFHRRCRLCGIVEIVTTYGWQRDPGECDSVCYEPGEPDPPEDDDDDD
jgi:hypothetical protein